mgnify:CR=1 FL=1
MNKILPNNQNNSRGVLVTEISQSFSGPLPHPDVLRKFNEIVPGAAERIMKMAEEQSAHRKELEKKVIDSDIARSKWGQILGFIIAITGLGISTIIAIYGSAIAGGVIGVGTLASLVGVFMYGSKTRSLERKEKSSS